MRAISGLEGAANQLETEAYPGTLASAQVLLQFLLRDSRECGKLRHRHKLIFPLVGKIPDFTEDFVAIPLAPPCNPLDVFGVDYASFLQHG